MAVLARPGAGKTTLLEHLTLVYARRVQRRFSPKAPKLLPILFYLRDIRDQVTSKEPPLLSRLLCERLSTVVGNQRAPIPPESWFEEQLLRERNYCLVMFDGLDEVADATQREQVSSWVNQQMQSYPNARFVVTSRPHGWNTAPVSDVTTIVQVEPFSFGDARSFVANWYLENQRMREQRRMDDGVRMEADRRTKALMKEIEGNVVLSELCVNPLLLTMITTVHDNQGTLPENRLALYKEICEVLLVRRQKEKGLADSLNAAKKQTLLQILALELMQAKTRQFTAADATRWLGNALAEVVGTDLTAANFISLVAQQSGLLVEREQGEFEFCHKSLQEYLSATQIKETNQESILLENLEESWWEETIRLYAAQVDTSGIIRAALAKPTVTTLTLAYDCMREGLKTPPELREQLEQTVDTDLESDDSGRAHLAAEVMLARRLRNLRRLDDRVDLDPNLLSNAEYQLFLDDKAHMRIRYSPAHWENQRFARGQARQAVTGVSPEAAREFTQWLTLTHAINTGTEIYRLPSLREVTTAELLPNAVGFWCQGPEGLTLEGFSKAELARHLTTLGIDPESRTDWLPLPVIQAQVAALDIRPHKQGPSDAAVAVWCHFMSYPTADENVIQFVGAYALAQSLTHAGLYLLLFRHYAACDRPLALDVARELARDLDRAFGLARAIDCVRALDLAFTRAFGLARALDFAFARARTLDLASALALDPGRELGSALDLARASALDLGRALGLDLARALDLGRTLAHDLARDPARDIEAARNFSPSTHHAINHAIDRAAHRATAFRNLFEQLRPPSDATVVKSGLETSLAILIASLKASDLDARCCAFEYRYLGPSSSLRSLFRRNEFYVAAQAFEDRARVAGELLEMANVYARRIELKHRGWEGIRIARERTRLSSNCDA